MKRENNFSSLFGAKSSSGGGNQIQSNFSLDFTVLGQSVLVGPRSKVVLRGKGYA